MKVKINCTYYVPDGKCSNPDIGKSLFGFGKRYCETYDTMSVYGIHNCNLRNPYPRPAPPPPPPEHYYIDKSRKKSDNDLKISSSITFGRGNKDDGKESR